MINVAVEGYSDQAAAIAVVRAAGQSVNRVFVAGGKSKLDPKIPKYRDAAQRMSWVVFRDSDGQCPVELRQSLLSDGAVPSPRFLLRFAHSMTEAWLLADRRGFSRYFSVAEARIPLDPESLSHAKRTLLALCAGSTSRAIRNDVVTPRGETGALYVRRINDFGLFGLECGVIVGARRRPGAF